MNLCGAIFILLWFSQLCCTQNIDSNKNKRNSALKDVPKLESFKNYEEMEGYLNTTEKISSLQNPENDTYIEAYNLHHIEPSKISRKLTKRSTPMFIKFELTDVKEPDEATKEFFKKIHKSLNISHLIEPTHRETGKNISEDIVTEEKVQIEKRSIDNFNTDNSRKKHKTPVISRKEFDTIMKLLMDINQPLTRKQHNNELPVVPYVAGFDRRYTGIAPKVGGHHLNQFGEKYKQYPLGGSQQFVYNPKHYQYPGVRPNYVTAYIPFSVGSLKASPLTNLQTTAPEVSQIRTISRPDSAQLVKVLPEINYVIKEVPAPNLKVPQPISPQHSSKTTDEASEIDYRNLNVYAPTPAKAILQEHSQIGYADYSQGGNDVNNEYLQQGGNEQLIPKQPLHAGQNPLDPDPRYGTLMTLVGKPPADQLYGLTYILGKELHLTDRPEDRTAPVVFHPDGPKQVQNAGEGAHLGYVPAENGILGQAQPIKPITEAPEEELETEHVAHVPPQLNPNSLSYKQIHSALSPNYDLHDDKKQLQQYASRYAFGYHVRDFHSGNDYSHRQNRDLDGVTRGQYHILLPDGRIQNVVYHADKSGFHADVSFESGIDHHHR